MMESAFRELVCPECRTDNVSTWVYEDDGVERQVIRCRECKQDFETEL